MMKSGLFNRAIWAAGLALLVAAAVPAAEAADKLRVGKAVAPAFSFTPVDIGHEKGFFRKYGIEVEISAFGGSAKLHQALAAGSIDIGLGSGPGMAFMAKGSPAIGVAAMAGPPLLLVLVVRPDAGIKTVKDLKGKRISVSTVASLTNWLTRQLSRQQGWGPDGIIVTPLGRPSGQIAAMRAKKTDGMLTALGLALVLEKKKAAKILVYFGDIIKDFHIHVIFATNKLRKENPSAVTRFLKGWFETIAFMRKNKAETVRISARVTRTPIPIRAKEYDIVMPMFSADGKFNPKAIKVLQKSYVELGILDKIPDPKVMYTEEYLPK